MKILSNLLRRIARQCNLSYSSARNILKKNRYHPYKAQIVQELKESDYASRADFANRLLLEKRTNCRFIEQIMFSDEAIFYLDGGINRQNYRHWSVENPN